MTLHSSVLKGTHAQEFYILFLILFLPLSITNRYKKQYSQQFRKSSSNSPRYRNFQSLTIFAQKQVAQLGVVAENVERSLELSLKLCVTGSF
jgi:hypothetical protein